MKRAEERAEKKRPKHIATVDGDKFQVKGEPTLYADPSAAMARARKVLPSEVIRISDGKVIAVFTGYIPTVPKEW